MPAKAKPVTCACGEVLFVKVPGYFVSCDRCDCVARMICLKISDELEGTWVGRLLRRMALNRTVLEEM